MVCSRNIEKCSGTGEESVRERDRERERGFESRVRVESRSDRAVIFNPVIMILVYTLSEMKSHLKTLSQGLIQCLNCQNNSFGNCMDYRVGKCRSIEVSFYDNSLDKR